MVRPLPVRLLTTLLAVVAAAGMGFAAAPARASDGYALDLYRPGDFVSQATPEGCIPAAMLTMMNIADGRADRQHPSQGRLYALARRLSTPKLVGAGAEAEGWARALDRLGYGPYEVRVEPTRATALLAAARAIRETGRPAGLMMWRGAHAWVMSGFRATADPVATADARVTHVVVQDPWYPRTSSIWGRSPRPGSVLSARALAADFLPFRRPTVRYPDKDGRFVLVLPVPRQAPQPSAASPYADLPVRLALR